MLYLQFILNNFRVFFDDEILVQCQIVNNMTLTKRLFVVVSISARSFKAKLEIAILLRIQRNFCNIQIIEPNIAIVLVLFFSLFQFIESILQPLVVVSDFFCSRKPKASSKVLLEIKINKRYLNEILKTNKQICTKVFL